MSRRISRRAFVAGTSATLATAAAGGTFAVVASRTENPVTRSAASPGPTAVPTPVPTPTSPLPGGSQTITAPGRLNIDTFDVQLTGESSVVEILGRTHSRLVQWEDPANQVIGADLAQRWEFPDPLTVVFHLDPAATWQDKPPVNGRRVTADDVVAHFKRSLEIASSARAPVAQRYHTYSTWESIDSPAAGQVRIRLKRPDPLLLDTLSGEFAMIQAPEAVAAYASAWPKADSDHVIGSGPWAFDWADDGVKFKAWRFGHRKPLLDELHVVEPSDAGKRFADGSLDEAILRDRRERTTIPAGATVSKRYEREIVMSSFFVGAQPWANTPLVNAISLALPRPHLAKALFGGHADPSYPLPPAVGWKRETETSYPGYGEPSQSDLTRLRTAWEASGGPGLGTITVDFPSVFDPLYSASSVVIDMLNQALGPQFKPAVETYTTISKRVLDRYYGNGRAAFWFGWGSPIPGPSRERFVAETYAVGAPGVRVTGAPPFDIADDAKNTIGAGFLGIVPWVQQYADVVRRPGIAGPDPSPFWNQHRDYLRSNG